MALHNEVTDTDQHVRRLLESLNLESVLWEQGAGTAELRELLKGGAKTEHGTGSGKPEFMFFSKNFLVIVEDKHRLDRLVSADEFGNPDTSYPAREQYAANGALHYAEHLVKQGYKRGVFAIGAVGDSRHLETSCWYVKGQDIKALPNTEDFSEYAPDQIEEFHRVSVLGQLPKAERDLKEVKQVASNVHELMRNYGNLEGERKATTVAAILLALKYSDFSLDNLRGSDVEGQTDGWKIYNAAEGYLNLNYKGTDNGNSGKRGTVMDEFAFIRSSVTLNTPQQRLGGITPLRKFTEVLEDDILSHVTSSSSFDILGNFYGEFVKYGGSDGNALGIVLTPHHITTLMVDLLEIGKDDYVLDPCAGTAAFLIAAMNRMVESAKGDPARIDDIRANRLHGVELQEKLYAIGVSNMILRGDGKAHFHRNDIFHVDPTALRTSLIRGVPVEHGFTAGLMNPPYSQAKDETTQHLSELLFVKRALDLLNEGARFAAIIPTSSLTNAKSNVAQKKMILDSHTLEGVVTVNEDAFTKQNAGVNTAIAIFTAGRPHPETKRAKFIDFKDDGMVIRPHVGLVGDGTERGKYDHLLRVWHGDEDDGTAFIVRSTVGFDDEWLHGYFYFRDDAPTTDKFVRAVNEYTIFRLGQVTKGRIDLVPMLEKPRDTPLAYDVTELDWQPFTWDEIGVSVLKRGKRLKSGDHLPGKRPYISSTAANNGLDAYVGNKEGVRTYEDCLTIANSGSVGSTFYHPYEFVASDHVTALKIPGLSQNAYLFLATCLEHSFEGKYGFNREISDKRIARETILLPTLDGQNPDWEGMAAYITQIESNVVLGLGSYLQAIAPDQ